MLLKVTFMLNIISSIDNMLYLFYFYYFVVKDAPLFVTLILHLTSTFLNTFHCVVLSVTDVCSDKYLPSE